MARLVAGQGFALDPDEARLANGVVADAFTTVPDASSIAAGAGSLTVARTVVGRTHATLLDYAAFGNGAGVRFTGAAAQDSGHPGVPSGRSFDGGIDRAIYTADPRRYVLQGGAYRAETPVALALDARSHLAANRDLAAVCGENTLFGNAGNDVLLGGYGADQMDGGAGADVFSIRTLNDSTLAAPDAIITFNGAVVAQQALQGLAGYAPVGAEGDRIDASENRCHHRHHRHRCLHLRRRRLHRGRPAAPSDLRNGHADRGRGERRWSGRLPHPGQHCQLHFLRFRLRAVGARPPS